MSDLSLEDLRNKASHALFVRMHEDSTRSSADPAWSTSSITLNFFGGLLGLEKRDTKTEMVRALGVALAKADTRMCETIIATLKK